MTNKMTRTLAAVLCIALLLGCGTAVFAAEDHNIMLTTAAPNPSNLLIMPLIAPSPVAGSAAGLEQFEDVDPNAWYAEDLAWCVENGLLNGKSETTMAPNDTIKRGELVSILYRIEGKPANRYDAIFMDVPGGSWYEKAIVWALGSGVVKGNGDGTFGPEKEITREQLATMLYQYEQYKGGGFVGSWMFLLDFPDAADVSEWANEAMHWCVMKQIINGKDGKLDPKGPATRAEAAAMLHRMDPEIKSSAEMPILGGWSTDAEPATLDTAKMPESAAAAYEKFLMTESRSTYSLLAYLGSQVVAGANYAYVCQKTEPDGTSALVELVLYRDLQGNVTVRNESPLTSEHYSEDGTITFPEAMLMGGFFAGDAVGGFAAVESEARRAFNQAAAQATDDVRYTPLALLGRQVVAGTNYRYLCKAEKGTENPQTVLCVVKVYAALDGTAEWMPLGNFRY